MHGNAKVVMERRLILKRFLMAEWPSTTAKVGLSRSNFTNEGGFGLRRFEMDGG
jgi:hypothetical protein